MQTHNPTRPFSPPPNDPARQALQRLEQTAAWLTTVQDALPTPSQPLLDALRHNDRERITAQRADLALALHAYWHAEATPGNDRQAAVAEHLERSLRDEAILKTAEGDLQPGAVQCLASSETSDALRGADVYTLSIKLTEQRAAEIKGALVMSSESGRTLLALPGSGLTEHASLVTLRQTLALWLNDETLRWAVLGAADLRHQDAVHAVTEDADLSLETFAEQDIQLQRLTGHPYRHAIERLIDKQYEDLRYLCDESTDTAPQRLLSRLQAVLRQSGLLGPVAMLAQREQALIERAARSNLPDWIKSASAEQISAYGLHLTRYDQGREVLSSLLDGAESAEQFARISLQRSLANDLGYDLSPDAVLLTTQRALPDALGSYTQTRTLTELALRGLHPGDDNHDSPFVTGTEIAVHGLPGQVDYPALSPHYLAGLVTRSDLRTHFAAYRDALHAVPANQRHMREVLRLQLAEAACAARMQGHLDADDYEWVERVFTSTTANLPGRTRVQHVALNNLPFLKQLLVFRKESPAGALERLVLFAAHAPRAQRFQAFHDETRLLHELVSWTANEDMSAYLLAQVPAAARAELDRTLSALNRKPMPEPGFVRLMSPETDEEAFQALLDQQLKVARSDHDQHTPAWYMSASVSQRQQLVALEDALQGALDHYTARADTAVEAFDQYVHRRAGEKINQLLSLAEGSVDPDQIVITTPRERLTYTQMMRDGYDDSISLLTPTADSMATFSGPPGVDLSPLTPTRVAGSVRGSWLADDYARLIRATLLDPQSPGYDDRRNASSVITQLRMQAAALRSLLKGHIDGPHYQWLEPAISLVRHNDADTRARYPVYPLQIHIDKPFIASNLSRVDQLVIPDAQITHVETVQGCFALLSNETRLSALLYTPDAPDGVEFRLFSAFVASLGQPGMIDYYKDRCRLKARRVLSFFLNDMKQGNAHKAPFLPSASIQDFAHVCFNRPLERKLRDIEETTTGRHDMLSQLIWNSIDLVATVVTLPFPPASFAVGVALSLRDNVRALQALSGHTPQEAGGLVLASVLNMAGAAGDMATGLKGFGGVARKLARDTRHSSPLSAVEGARPGASRQRLHPVDIQHERFLVGRPDAQGRAPVYLNPGFEGDDAYATGQFAIRNADGQWRPLESPTPAVATPHQIDTTRAVDVSLSRLHALTEGHAAGVHVGNGKCYIGLNERVFQVQYDARVGVWMIVDPNHPFAFFGRQPVRLNAEGQWQLVERAGLRGGGDDLPGSYRPLSEQAAQSETAGRSLHDYEVPTKMQPALDVILGIDELNSVGPGFDELFELYYAQMRETYTALRNKLYRDADAFFSRPVVLPPRPVSPASGEPLSFGAFLQSVFTQSNGLVFSEALKSIASKRLLMMHMPKLAEHGVEVLYLQHLFTDKHLRKLAKYRAKGSSVRSGSHEIKHDLEGINGGALDNLSREYDYYHLIKEAHRHNIEVRPFSSSTSYSVDAHPVSVAASDPDAAQKMSKYFGHKVISADTEAAPGKRWVALLEQNLATTHGQIPGIAEMEGVVSVHVTDHMTGSVVRVSQNKNLAGLDIGQPRSDFIVEFSAAPQAGHSPAPGLPVAVDKTPVASASLSHRETGFQWSEASGWQRIEAGQWLPDNPITALQQSLADAIYEVPAASRNTLYEMIYFERKGLDTHYFHMDETLMAVQSEFAELRSTLQRDARQVLTVDLPARPSMPRVEPGLDDATFLQRAYRHTDGLVVGEYHASIGSKKFIIDNLQTLVDQQVKTLYLEHLLTDLHQADLDRFVETGQMSKRLLHALQVLDNGHMTDPAKVYTFEKLVLKARQHGIEIRAIDCTASYHLKGIAHDTPTTRQQMMNFFASRTIRRHQAVMGRHKWIALVGNSHSNTFADTVPGVAELQGAIGVQVYDVPVGSATGISVDAGEKVRLPLSNRQVFLKGDFRIDKAVSRTPAILRPPQPLSLEQRLPRAGMFVTEQQEGAYMIIHRSRDQAIHRTPVQVNGAGKVFVDRPTWSAVHLQSYDDIDALVQALEDINLTRVA